MTERATQGERTPSCARPADVGARSPECAIRYEGVSFSYKPGVPFMEGLSAAIPAGAVTSIVGPNGCGKSTLLRLLNRLCPHFYEGKLDGSVLVDGKNLQTYLCMKWRNSWEACSRIPDPSSIT